ncbi:MAG: hypothetical protein JRJ87_27470 [Deltaproteobacteria bacterium]|nr:hypothetical protein [Deltaproteobacteria bacterium]
MRKFSSREGLKNSILVLLLSALIVLLPGCIDLPDFTVPDHIEEFAREYIDILRQADKQQAKELLHQSLAESVDPNDFDNLVEAVGSEQIDNITLLPIRVMEAEKGNGYVFGVMITRDDAMIGGTIGITEIEDDIRVVGISLMGPTDSRAAQVGEGDSLKLSQQISELIDYDGEAEFFPIGFIKVFMWLWIVFAILGLVVLCAVWSVFEQAGEPGWAVLVPIYSTIVMARVGEKPLWLAILAALGGFIPIVGGLISFIAYLMIMIGVAKSFERSVWFGLGLFFLPVIFFPILAFSSPKAAASGPSDQGHSNEDFWAQKLASANVPTAAPATIPFDQKRFEPEPIFLEPIVTEEFIRFYCTCGKKIKVPGIHAGKSGRCPACSARFKVPQQSQAEPPAQQTADDLIRFACACGKKIKVPAKLAGRTGRCPRCQVEVTIPEKPLA